MRIGVSRWAVWLGLLVLLAGAASVLIIANRAKDQSSTETSTKTDTTATALRGFSLSPKSFASADLAAFFSTAAEYGNVLSWAGHYSDLGKSSGNAAITVLSESRKRRLTPVLITGPNKGEVFDGIFVESFRSSVLDFVKNNEVPYLGLGNEIDSVYRESPSRYTNLVSIIETLVADIRAASPETKIFTVFQLEQTKGLQGGLFGKKNDPNDHTWQLVTGLKNFDFVAFTTYPSLIYQSPSEIPEEHYTDIQNHTSLPILFTEIGWFRKTPVAGWDSTEQEQADFIGRFDELTTRVNPRIVIWPFLYDQNVATPFQNMGLLGVNETATQGLDAWQLYRNRKTTVTE